MTQSLRQEGQRGSFHRGLFEIDASERMNSKPCPGLCHPLEPHFDAPESDVHVEELHERSPSGDLAVATDREGVERVHGPHVII